MMIQPLKTASSPPAETLEEIAHRLVEQVYATQVPTRFCLYGDILSALRNRDERAAKIADKYVADMRSVPKRTEYGEGCLNAGIYIAKAIREGK